jgi:type VI secretion system protein ImpG
MDDRLLRLYNEELGHLRELGGEFAQEFPKIAGRLGIESAEVADPYVERLIEGFAFMAARVQLKIEAEQPHLVAHLLDSIYPNFLAPVPSMTIARLQVDPSNPNLADGHVIERNSAVFSEVPRGHNTRCEFRTAQAVTLWPIELAAVHYFSYAQDVLPSQFAPAKTMKGGIRIRLRAGDGQTFSALPLNELRFYISAPGELAFRLHELITGSAMGTLIRPASNAEDIIAPDSWRGSDNVRPVGFAADEALLPDNIRTFSGHRSLQELAASPNRFLFFDVLDLAGRLADVDANEVEIIILLAKGDDSLDSLIDASSLALFCTPAINLFSKRLDRIEVSESEWQHHAIADRTRPGDFEIHHIESVVGFSGAHVELQHFKPLYSNSHHRPAGADHRATDGYYTVRREPRMLSAHERREGTRSSYIGEELYLSLTDPQHAPYRNDLRQLSLIGLVSNRDLPNLLPHTTTQSGRTQWTLDASGPVDRVDVLSGPTRPHTRRPIGDLGWRLVQHLTLNHLALAGEPPDQVAAALRSALTLYGPPNDANWKRQVDGVRSLKAERVTRRLPFNGPLTFGSGTALTLELDEMAYQGTSAFLFASVLEHYFARHAAINSFTQLTLITPQRGEVMRWAPRVGLRDTA